MGAFHYLGHMVPKGLVALTRLFDIVIILCSGPSCQGQELAWPISEMHHVCIADSKLATVHAHWDQVRGNKKHPIRVSFAYGRIFGYCRRRLGLNYSSDLKYLVMEEDFKWRDKGHDIHSLRGFVHNGSWDVLRFGYNPMPKMFNVTESNRTRCLEHCHCESVLNHICFVRGCDARSTVAQAFSARGAMAMEQYAYRVMNGTKDNVTIAGEAKSIRAVDLFLAATPRLDVYYHAPGLITDSSNDTWKQGFDDRMDLFAEHCYRPNLRRHII